MLALLVSIDMICSKLRRPVSPARWIKEIAVHIRMMLAARAGRHPYRDGMEFTRKISYELLLARITMHEIAQDLCLMFNNGVRLGGQQLRTR